jgi:hypothetical protein
MNIEWDAKYPLSNVTILPRGISDHNPLHISFGKRRQIQESVFRFEKWWLSVEGFPDLVKKTWDTKRVFGLEMRWDEIDPSYLWGRDHPV